MPQGILSLTAGCHSSPFLSSFVLSLVTFTKIPWTQPSLALGYSRSVAGLAVAGKSDFVRPLAQTRDLQVQAISILSQVHSVMFFINQVPPGQE